MKLSFSIISVRLVMMACAFVLLSMVAPWSVNDAHAQDLDNVTISADGMLSDIHGSSAYRANLVKVMAQRAVDAAEAG